MLKHEKERIKRIHVDQKSAETLKRAKDYAEDLTETGVELGLILVRAFTKKQLQQVLLRPEKFDKAFPGSEVSRLAQEELTDRLLTLDKENTNG